MTRLKLAIVAGHITALLLLGYAGNIFAQQPQEFGPLRLGPITLGAGCGQFDQVLPWLESAGYSPVVVGELDDGLSLFIMSDKKNTGGQVMVVRPDGQACIFFRASKIDIPFLYMMESFNNVPNQDRPEKDRGGEEGFETL